MDQDIRNNRLYRKLRPSKAGFVISAAVSAVLILAVLAIGVFAMISVYNTQGTSDFAATTVIMIIALAILGFISVRGIKKQKRQNDVREKRLEALDSAELLRIDEQLDSLEYLYKTFYLTDEYLYVPRAKLLISYSDIAGFKTIIHSTNGITDGAKVVITDTAGVKYEFSVRQWKLFLTKRDYFIRDLDEKISNMTE